MVNVANACVIVFSDYTGPQTFEECATYIEKQFRARASDKNCYFQRTCATDTKSIESVFNACIDIILGKYLNKCGMF